MKNLGRHQEGFSLLEIIIVIALLWFLGSTLGLFARGFLGQGEVEARELQRRAIEAAAQAYYIDTMGLPGAGGGQYPTGAARGGPLGPDTYVDFNILVAQRYLPQVPPNVAADNPGGSPEGRYLWYVNAAGTVDAIVLDPSRPTSTSTPMPTPTATLTPTPTPTPGQTNTPTPTPTPGQTNTPTPTPTPADDDETPTPSPTPTASPGPTFTPTPTPTATAYDGFEGAGWGNGYGWKAEWYHEGDTENVAEGDAHTGQKHLRLRRNTGFVSRSVDLSGKTYAYLTFWAKVDSFEDGDYATALVKPNGGGWTVVKTFTAADGEDYRLISIDLSGFTLSANFTIAFNAEMGDVQDRLYIDDVTIVAW